MPHPHHIPPPPCRRGPEPVMPVPFGPAQRFDFPSWVRRELGAVHALVPSEASPTNKLADKAWVQRQTGDIGNKADKAPPAAEGNLAALAQDGNLADSGAKPSDFATAAQGAKADTAYQKPQDGIPGTDMSQSVQTSLGKADTAVQPGGVARFVDDAAYDPAYGSPAKPAILLKHGQDVVAAIDASAFVVDGMVEDVAIVTVTPQEATQELPAGSYLRITFNAAAGKRDIYIPIADIFDPDDYYDKTAADGRFAQKATSLSGYGITDAKIGDDGTITLGGRTITPVTDVSDKVDKHNGQVDESLTVNAGAGVDEHGFPKPSVVVLHTESADLVIVNDGGHCYLEIRYQYGSPARLDLPVNTGTLTVAGDILPVLATPVNWTDTFTFETDHLYYAADSYAMAVYRCVGGYTGMFDPSDPSKFELASVDAMLARLRASLVVKVDKLSGATAGDIPSLDSNGNLARSGMNRDANGNLNAAKFDYDNSMVLDYDSAAVGTVVNKASTPVVSHSGTLYFVRKSFVKTSSWSADETTGRLLKPGAGGVGSTAWGDTTQAYGNGADSEGKHTRAVGAGAHAEGEDTDALNTSAHAEGAHTLAQNRSEHAEGEYNVSHKASETFGDAGNTLLSAGIGTSAANRANAFEFMQNGDLYLKGVGGYEGTEIAGKLTVAAVLAGILSDAASRLRQAATYPEFNPGKEGGYSVGSMVTHEGTIYECTSYHTGAWNVNNFATRTIGWLLGTKQDKINLVGILKGAGAGGVTQAVAGVDYAEPGDLRYALGEPITPSSAYGVHILPLEDRTVNLFEPDAAYNSLSIVVPPKPEDGGARDFFLRVDMTDQGASLSNVTVAPASDPRAYATVETADGSFPAFPQGSVTMLYFSEVKEDVFLLTARRVVTAQGGSV